MPLHSPALTAQKLGVAFAALKHASPAGVYVAPHPDEPLVWSGVLFVRKGPYANAVLRFQIRFPPLYPLRPPILALLSDVFHPLVTPLTTYTYTYSARATDAEPASASDRDRLPPGGLSLRHGFPEWFDGSSRDSVTMKKDDVTTAVRPGRDDRGNEMPISTTARTVQLLHYLRVAFESEGLLDSVPLEAAANTGAWHAWRSYRSKTAGLGSVAPQSGLPGDSPSATTAAVDGERSKSPRQQQPGGARRPGEWNWQGVWEDRVRKSVQASTADHMLYAAAAAVDADDVICFSKMDAQAVVDGMMAAEKSAVS